MRDLKINEIHEVNGGHNTIEAGLAVAGMAAFGPLGALGLPLAWNAGNMIGDYLYNTYIG